LEAMVSAQLGDEQPIRNLASSPAFVQSIKSRIADGIPAPFLGAAMADATLGDKVLAGMRQQPGDGAKGLANYEGGPGYSLPGPDKPPAEEDENIGKSLALGTATLDAAMQFLAAGSSPVAYYDYKTGTHWASHNNPLERIPYPSWLAMQMRNTLCPGDLLEVKPVQVATVDVPDREIITTTNDGRGRKVTARGRNAVPLTAAYAFADGEERAILVLNRSLNDSCEVMFDLPAGWTGPTRQYMLTAKDPKMHNRFTENVRVTESDGPAFAEQITLQIPPASVVVLQSKK